MRCQNCAEINLTDITFCKVYSCVNRWDVRWCPYRNKRKKYMIKMDRFIEEFLGSIDLILFKSIYW